MCQVGGAEEEPVQGAGAAAVPRLSEVDGAVEHGVHAELPEGGGAAGHHDEGGEVEEGEDGQHELPGQQAERAVLGHQRPGGVVGEEPEAALPGPQPPDVAVHLGPGELVAAGGEEGLGVGGQDVQPAGHHPRQQGRQGQGGQHGCNPG